MLNQIKYDTIMNQKNTNKRQDLILSLLARNPNLPIGAIIENVRKDFGEISKITINRDLLYLLTLGFLEKEGRGKATLYKLSRHYNLIKKVDIPAYFKTEPDKREVLNSFNFQIFEFLTNIFSGQEKNI